MSQKTLFLAFILSILWNDAPGAEKVPDELQRAANTAGEYLLTLYSNDRLGNEKVRFPGPEGATLVGRAVLSDEKLALVREEVSGLKLGLVESFRLQGRAIKPDSKGEYPVGTSVSFTTQARGVILLIPVVKLASGWKVDVRFWLAVRKKCKENDPEVVTRKFLYGLISRKENELKEFVVPGSDLRSIIKGKAPVEDQYYALALEMPVVDSMEGEGMLLADGTAVTVQQSTPQSKWLTGLYGYYKLVFELRLEKDKWRVVPRDYLSVISRCETRSATKDQWEPLRVVLPPDIMTQKVAQRAEAPKPMMASAASNSVRKLVASADIGIGSSIEEVRKTLGNPKGQIAMGKKAIWTYPALTVEFHEGQVTALNGVSGPPVQKTQGSAPVMPSGRPLSGGTVVPSAPDATISEAQLAANAAGQYFLTLGTGDRGGNEAISYPPSEGGRLCAMLFYPRDVSDETIAKVREEISGMNLTREAPFKYQGRVVKPDGKGRYPVGTTTVLCTSHVGTTQAFSPLLYGNHDYTLIPVIKTEAGWKVDVRFWLARLNGVTPARALNASAPEWVVGEFLHRLFRNNIHALKELTPADGDVLSLTNNRMAAADSELFDPGNVGLYLAEAQTGEAMLVADGTVVVAQASTDQSKWLTGFWGRHQTLLFELRREQNGWRMVPRDYRWVIRNGKMEFDACGTLAELKMALPPPVPKPPDIKAAVQRPHYVVMAEGEAKAALEVIMAELQAADDWSSLARHIDWVSVFLQTKLDVLKSLAIRTPDELRDFYISVQSQPSEIVRRPLGIWIPSPQPEETPLFDRLEQAIREVEPSVLNEIQESLSVWKSVEFTAEEQPGEGEGRVVKMTISEGRDTADIHVAMVKIGGECLIDARWLPKALQDIQDDFLENKKVSTAIREIQKAVQVRHDNKAGSSQ